jgi:transcriptional regulator with PAS, ATPase and Fis domain
VAEIFSSYRWPGNVRELANLVEHLVVVTNEPVLRLEHIPSKYVSKTEEKDEEIPEEMKSLREEVERFETQLIKKVLARTHNYEEAANILRISLSTLTRRIRKVNNDRHN